MDDISVLTRSGINFSQMKQVILTYLLKNVSLTNLYLVFFRKVPKCFLFTENVQMMLLGSLFSSRFPFAVRSINVPGITGEVMNVRMKDNFGRHNHFSFHNYVYPMMYKYENDVTAKVYITQENLSIYDLVLKWYLCNNSYMLSDVVGTIEILFTDAYFVPYKSVILYNVFVKGVGSISSLSSESSGNLLDFDINMVCNAFEVNNDYVKLVQRYNVLTKYLKDSISKSVISKGNRVNDNK